MNFLKVAWRDITKIFKNKFIRVSVTAIIIVPLLYSLLYLYAFWDPYNKLSDMPVAVVNMDKGGVRNSEEVNYGKDITNKLKDNKKIGWRFVDYNEAKKGVEGNKYYAMFVIPEDFSQKLLSSTDGKPVKPEILYSANEKRNFLAAQINGKVLVELKAEIVKNISSEFTKETFNNLFELKDGMLKAADGSEELNNGILKVANGSKTISDGLKQFDNSAVKLSGGVSELYNGSKIISNALGQIKTGSNTLAEKLNAANNGTIKLVEGSKKLAEGATAIEVGIQKLDSGLNTTATDSKGKPLGLKEGAKAVDDGVNALIASMGNSQSVLNGAIASYLKPYLAAHPDAMADKNMQQFLNTLNAMKAETEKPETQMKLVALKNGADSLYKGIDTVAQTVNKQVLPGVSTIKSGSIQLNSGLEVLSSGLTIAVVGSTKISDGANSVLDGSIKLRDGLGVINSNIPQFTEGTKKLRNGAVELSEGAMKLAEGSKELSDKLREGSDKLNTSLVNDSNTMGEFISEPISISESPVYQVKNYGTGFAPYFIPLSLWIGAIMMFFVITDRVDDDIEASSTSLVLGKFLSYGYIGTVQAVLASAIVIALGLRPSNIPLYFLFNIFMSFVFIAIIQSLIFLLGDAGRLLSIILLILQLTSCAGTFPLEVVPKFFKVLNPFMPFTYCVTALRELITGTNYGVLIRCVVVLAIVMVVFLFISVTMKSHADKLKAKIREEKKLIEAI